MRQVYLDHAATTPMDPEVLEAMLRVGAGTFGNPSSGHLFGRRARNLVDESAERIAEVIGARRLEEIVFTSGGTEADNLALRGMDALLDPELAIAVSTIEHAAVLDTVDQLEARGRRILRLPVDARGLLAPGTLQSCLDNERVGLVSVIWANNEIGSVQDMTALAAICRKAEVPLHSDAVQALGRLPVRVDEPGIDLLSGSAHKFYGPKGVGFLYCRRGMRLAPCITGGLQQGGLRGGTENLIGIVGMGLALAKAASMRETEALRLRELAAHFLRELGPVEKMKINADGRELPGHLSLSFEEVQGETLLLSLDLDGIAVSAGSACHTGSIEPSHVLKAIGLNDRLAAGSIRLVPGRNTTAEDLSYVAGRLREHATRLKGTQ